MRLSPRISAALLACTLSLGSLAMAGEPSKEDVKKAEELFALGNKLMKDDKLTEACTAYEQSMKLAPATGTAINVAECHEAQGRTASAYSDWLEAGRLAEQKNKPDKAKKAKERAAALNERLSTLEIRLPPSLVADTSASVLLDEVPVDPQRLGAPNPIDPGTHYVEVRAPGKIGWRTKVVVAPEADHQTVTVPELSAIDQAAAPPPPPAPVKPSTATITPTPTPAPAPAPDDHRSHLLRTTGYGLGALGLVGLGLGGYYGFSAQKIENRSTRTSDDLATERSDITRARVLLGVGAACAVTGVVLILVDSGSPSRPRSDAARVVATPVAGPGFGGLSVVGTF